MMQIMREVFATHLWLRQFNVIPRLTGGFAGKFGPARSIDDGGWAGEPEQFGFGPQCLGYAGYHLTDFLRHLFADLCIVGAHRAFEVDLLRQHIPRIAALNAGDADHHRLLSAEVAADQGLQSGDDVAGGDNAVDTVFRVCGVRAFAGDGYLEAVNVGIERPPLWWRRCRPAIAAHCAGQKW